MLAAGDVWLVSSRPWTIDPQERVRALFDRRLSPREDPSFAGVQVRRYEPPCPTSLAGDTPDNHT